jgi:hypothetical protein
VYRPAARGMAESALPKRPLEQVTQSIVRPVAKIAKGERSPTAEVSLFA